MNRSAVNRNRIANLAVVCVVAALYIFTGCPIRFLFGVSCPGCGMTRAVLSLLKLDFTAAAHNHLLVFALPVLAVLFLLRKRIGEKPFQISLWVCLGLSVVYYIFRFVHGSEVVYADFTKGFLYKAYLRIS